MGRVGVCLGLCLAWAAPAAAEGHVPFETIDEQERQEMLQRYNGDQEMLAAYEAKVREFANKRFAQRFAEGRTKERDLPAVQAGIDDKVAMERSLEARRAYAEIPITRDLESARSSGTPRVTGDGRAVALPSGDVAHEVPLPRTPPGYSAQARFYGDPRTGTITHFVGTDGVVRPYVPLRDAI